MKPFIRPLIILLSIVGISLLHYLTPLHLHYLHDIFQRFYYLPILLSALWFGFRGGVFCSLLVSIFYAPHILFQWGGALTVEMEKYMEIVMYNVVGGITGLLAQRERERSVELQKTADGLQQSLQTLQKQSEKIISIESELRRTEKLSTMGEMAAVLAHEIRNPLGSIRGTAEILRDDYPAGSPKHEFIEIQIKETERLNRVVDGFLHIAREQGREVHSCSLNEEIENIVSIVERDAAVRGIKLKSAILPDGVDRIMADGEKLRQAFLNLAINAVQGSKPGGEVLISIKKVESNYEISICDKGLGIAPENMSKIMEPFYTTKHDGTGLGLAVTKKIIESHGGKLSFVSEVGVGTTAFVLLPCGKVTL